MIVRETDIPGLFDVTFDNGRELHDVTVGQLAAVYRESYEYVTARVRADSGRIGPLPLLQLRGTTQDSLDPR